MEAGQKRRRSWLAKIATPGGSISEGSVVDASEDILAVLFESHDIPDLPIASKVGINLKSDSVSVDVRARVTLRAEVRGQVRYQFQLSDQHGSDFCGLMFRRDAYRVRPDVGQSVQVLIEGEHGSKIATSLHDISDGGVGLIVSAEHEPVLFRFKDLRFSFRLPGDDAPFDFVGTVCHRSLQGTTIRYGLRFDEKATASFDEQADRVHRYVVRRQVEVIRRAKNPASED